MTPQLTKSHPGQRTARVRKLLVRGACGALVAGVAWSAMTDVAHAAPSPILSQGLVGLREGAVGDDVKAVQQALMKAGVTVPGGADGQFGPATRNALIEFQGRKGLTKSGEVDAATASALGLSSSGSAGPAAGTAFNGLQQGAEGAAVKELQQKLSAAGVYLAGGVDGDFGPGTAKAVSDYQRWNSLPVSGLVDAETAKRLGLTGASGAPGTTVPTPPAPTTPPSTLSSNPFVGLAQGAKGDLVKQLQTALINAGVTVRGGADGDFGSATKSALSSYQGANGLGVSGVVYEATATKLGLGSSTPVVPTAPPAPPPAAPTTPTNPYVGLQNGASGALVKDLQTALLTAGINVRGGADGVFGNATKSALASYQQSNGLAASGSVDAASATKLGLGGTPPTPTAPTPPPATSSTNPYVGLAVGAKGTLVKELQAALMDTGLVIRGGADGDFGNATKTALQAFQSVNGINATGVLTEKGAGILALGTPAPQPSGYGSTATATGYPAKGESSDRVRSLQQLMIDWKINVVGGADGSFGNATAAAITSFQKVHGLTVTGTVTQETADKMGLSPSSSTATPPSSSSIVMKRFPIQGQCYYGNTWGAARGGGRTHEGVDIIAAEGKLLYAVVDGTITKQYWDSPGALAGNGLRVAEANGTYFTYLHMSSFAPGIKVGTKVKAGDVIGYVGNTGSSATPHLHFEIHPGGGAAVNPYPYVKAIDDCGNTTPQHQSSFG